MRNGQPAVALTRSERRARHGNLLAICDGTCGSAPVCQLGDGLRLDAQPGIGSGEHAHQRLGPDRRPVAAVQPHRTGHASRRLGALHELQVGLLAGADWPGGQMVGAKHGRVSGRALSSGRQPAKGRPLGYAAWMVATERCGSKDC